MPKFPATHATGRGTPSAPTFVRGTGKTFAVSPQSTFPNTQRRQTPAADTAAAPHSAGRGTPAGPDFVKVSGKTGPVKPQTVFLNSPPAPSGALYYQNPSVTGQPVPGAPLKGQ